MYTEIICYYISTLEKDFTRMIKPITLHQTRFGADTITKDPKTGDYKDPLMKWPLRGMAFTNEVGESLRPIIGNTATLFWVPVFLYIHSSTTCLSSYLKYFFFYKIIAVGFFSANIYQIQ